LFIKKRWQDLQLEWAFYAYGIFLGVIVSHSYFWASGQNGSVGLTRIATQGMPLFVLLHLYYIGKIQLFRHVIANVIFVIFVAMLMFALVNSKQYPIKANPMDQQVLKAAEYLRSIEKDLKGKKIYYQFPLLSFALNENPKINNDRLVEHSFYDLDNDLKNVLKPGDIIIRDSHFGPVEGNLPMEKIKMHPELVLIKEFISSEQIEDQFNEKEGVIILQYIPLDKQIKSKVQIEKKSIEKHVRIPKNKEFTSIRDYLPLFSGNSKLTISLTSL